ncbi:MAG: N-acetylneuraminate synthase family protein [Anaerolineaceae bacterium]|nr:N-acetylneuraminate synthase family protein [Anaerolineaceae bacterium]
MEIKIGNKKIGYDHPVYFVADIAANHDGNLDRAKMLIHIAKESGADAAKFQNFKAAKIVSDYGFKHMGGQQSHQSKWKKSVFEVYQDASVPDRWSSELKECCEKEGIEYFSAPYDFDSIDWLDQYINVYKIGSGDIDWIEELEKISEKHKPVLLATGASNLADVQRAVDTILPINPELVLMQCNTNYTADDDNFNHIHLRVLETYHQIWPELILGLSDHTSGHATVLGAVALGARVIEKHFTDDNNRIGPDHKFAMNPKSWEEMVINTRQLEKALGSREKFIAGNEQETCVIQRRCLRAARDIKAGETFTRDMIDVLRPAIKGAILPNEINAVIGTKAVKDLPFGIELRWTDLIA